MSFEFILASFAALGIFIYLLYTLAYPERF